MVLVASHRGGGGHLLTIAPSPHKHKQTNTNTQIQKQKVRQDMMVGKHRWGGRLLHTMLSLHTNTNKKTNTKTNTNTKTTDGGGSHLGWGCCLILIALHRNYVEKYTNSLPFDKKRWRLDFIYCLWQNDTSSLQIEPLWRGLISILPWGMVAAHSQQCIGVYFNAT